MKQEKILQRVQREEVLLKFCFVPRSSVDIGGVSSSKEHFHYNI